MAQTETRQIQRWSGDALQATAEHIACELPVAIVYNGISHVVMMATPGDLDDFALGFSLTEGIIAGPEELYESEPVRRETGIEIEMRISAERFAELKARRRNLTGRTGCGLCGAESLEQAVRPLPTVAQRQQFGSAAIQRAIEELAASQPLQEETGAVHAAAWVDRDGGMLLVREDVGRHNALDKLIGGMARQQSLGGDGFLVVSSRASYEMISKAVNAGFELLVAISAPTTLAIDLADSSGLTLVGFARPGRHTVYTHPQRLLRER